MSNDPNAQGENEEVQETPASEGENTASPEEDNEGTGDENSGDEENSGGEEITPLTAENLSLPDNLQADEKFVSSFIDTLNDADLSPQDRANALTQIHADAMSAMLEQVQTDAVAEIQKWGEDIASHKDLGGDNLAATEAAVADVMQEFGSPELSEWIDTTGIGNRVEFVEFLTKVSRVISEGKPTVGDPTSEETKTQAQRIFNSKDE